VDVVGSDDEHIVQAFVFGQFGLFGNHFIVGAVTLDGVGPFLGFFERDFGVREQGAGHHAAGAVHVNGLLMGMHDECAFAAANQSDFQWFL
jgi:hypothetical protein